MREKRNPIKICYTLTRTYNKNEFHLLIIFESVLHKNWKKKLFIGNFNLLDLL